MKNGQLFQYIPCILNKFCPIFNKLICPFAFAGCYTARQGKDIPSIIKGQAGCYKRAAFERCFYNQHASGETAYNPISLGKVCCKRRGAYGKFRYNSAI